MSTLSRDLVFLTLQFLDEEKFKETVHKLEQESGFFFNLKYFEDEVLNGNWDEVEKYLSGFTKVDDNRYSMKIFFEIRKQKYLEALDKHDRLMAVDILVDELKVFASYNEDLFKEITQLLTLENFRENQQLSKYGDAKSARAIMLVELKKLIEANPLFHDKLKFPNLKNSRLRTLVNQSLNWQHQLCNNPKPNPDIKTLFTDHSCGLPNGMHAPSLVSSPLSKAGCFPSLGTHMPFQPSPAPAPVPAAGWMSNPPAFPVVPGGAIGLTTQAATILNQVKTPQTSNITTEYSSVDSDSASRRTWSIGITNKASPRAHFNKEGSLMAVSACENVIKILANEDGLSLLRTSENHPCDSSKTVSENITKNGDCGNLSIKPRIIEEMADKSNIRENNVSTQCQSLRLMGNEIPCKISRLMYFNSGAGILSLASNATHFLWKLPRSHPGVKATVCVTPKVWQPSSGKFMKNEISITDPGESVSCFALSKNDCYVISASGGIISLFNMATFHRMTTFMPSPSAATFLAFHPEDNNIIAIGTDDSTIHIYNVNVDEVKTKFRGHSKRITGLAFSSSLHVLVSSGADAQICVWGADGWNKLRSKALQIPFGRSPTTKSDLQVQFHQNQIHFLAVHETQIALYDANSLDCMELWIPGEGYTAISHAAFSCDSQLVYACFVDATVCVFDASTLKLKCRIDPTSYLAANVSLKISATAIAAHPSVHNQIAVGLTDGSVHILEPLEPKGNWGALAESGSACSSQLAESSTSQN